jgi:hypothetical protein
MIGWKLAKEESKRAALRRRLLRPLPIATMYKRKADKVRPVDASDTDGSTPGGRADWKKIAWEKIKEIAARNADPTSKHHGFVVPRTADFPRNERLTAERAKKLIIGGPDAGRKGTAG